MNARRPARSAARNQPEPDHGHAALTGFGAGASPRSGKLDAALIALARTLARQAAADFLREGALLDTSCEQETTQ